jgi:chorismate mutase
MSGATGGEGEMIGTQMVGGDGGRVARGAATPEPGATADLERVRSRIEAVDREILRLLGERLDLAREAGRLKQAARLPLLDPAREAAVVRRAAVLARELGLPTEDVRNICWHLVGMCRRGQLADASRAEVR